MARRRNSSGSDALGGILTLVSMALAIVGMILFMLLKAAITAAVLLLPLALASALMLQARAGRVPPPLPDPADFDPSPETRQVETLLGKVGRMAARHTHLFESGCREGLYLTKESDETRFRSSRRGRELNSGMAAIEGEISAVLNEVAEIRRSVGERLPVWRSGFDRWVKRRAIGLALRPALLVMIAVGGALQMYRSSGGEQLALRLDQLLLWDPVPQINSGPAVGGVVAGYLAFGIAFQLQRRRLPRRIDGSCADGWIELENKWSDATPPGHHFAAPADDFDDGRSFGSGNRDQEQATDRDEGSESWWEVLGVPRNCSSDDAKAAYRSLMKDYHSDRVATLGKKLRDLAEAETKRINAAYEQAKTSLSLR